MIESDGRGGYAYSATPSARSASGATRVGGESHLSGPLGAAPVGLLCAPAVDGGAPRVLVAGFEEELFDGVVSWERLMSSGAPACDEPDRDVPDATGDLVSAPSAEVERPDAWSAPVVVRELLQPHGRHATLVRWRLASGAAATLRVRPFLPIAAQPARERIEAPQDAAREPHCSAVQVGGAVLVRESSRAAAVRFGADDGVDFRSAPGWVHGPSITADEGGGLDSAARYVTPGELRVELRSDDARSATFTLEMAVAGHGQRSPGVAFEHELGRRSRRDLEARPDGTSARIGDWAVRLAALTERCVHRTAQGRPVIGCPWSEHAAARSLTGAALWARLPGLVGAAGAPRPSGGPQGTGVAQGVWRSARWLVIAALEAFERDTPLECAAVGGQGALAATTSIVPAVEAGDLWFAWCLGELARLGHLGRDPALATRCADVRAAIARRLVDRCSGSQDDVASSALRCQLYGGADLALAADLCGSFAASADTSRSWARARRAFALGFRAAILSGEVQRALLLQAAGLSYGPLGSRARRALLEVFAEDALVAKSSDLDTLELADFVRAALHTLPRTRAAVATWRGLWLRSLDAASPDRLHDPRRLAAWRAIDLDLTSGELR